MTARVNEDVKKLELLMGMQFGIATVENSVEVPFQIKNRTIV
jgi:hypothetical protein